MHGFKQPILVCYSYIIQDTAMPVSLGVDTNANIVGGLVDMAQANSLMTTASMLIQIQV